MPTSPDSLGEDGGVNINNEAEEGRSYLFRLTRAPKRGPLGARDAELGFPYVARTAPTRLPRAGSIMVVRAPIFTLRACQAGSEADGRRDALRNDPTTPSKNSLLISPPLPLL